MSETNRNPDYDEVIYDLLAVGEQPQYKKAILGAVREAHISCRGACIDTEAWSSWEGLGLMRNCEHKVRIPEHSAGLNNSLYLGTLPGT